MRAVQRWLTVRRDVIELATCGGRPRAGARTGFGEHREKSQLVSCWPTMMLHFARISSLEAFVDVLSYLQAVIVV